MDTPSWTGDDSKRSIQRVHDPEASRPALESDRLKMIPFLVMTGLVPGMTGVAKACRPFDAPLSGPCESRQMLYTPD
jgi:hypothetical protein